MLTARIDAALHRRVKSKLSAAGSSFQDLIEEAVRGVDRRGADGNRVNTDPPEESTNEHASVSYTLHVTRRKSEKVIAIMGEIVSELDRVTGEEPASIATDPDEQTIHNLTAESAIDLRKSDRITKDIQEDGKKPRIVKRTPDKKVSGGSA